MRQRKSLKLYPLTMCYLQERTQKCTKLFFNHYLLILVSARLLGFHLIAEAQSVKFIMRVFDLKNHFDCLYDSCQII